MRRKIDNAKSAVIIKFAKNKQNITLLKRFDYNFKQKFHLYILHFYYKFATIL